MEVLHLTDLHVTKPNTSLQNLWATAVPRLGDRRFQFVVVSGDLTQRAGESEFTELLEFSQTLLGLLEVPDRRRIIFVPGNHDVDWACDFGNPLQPGDCTENLLRTFLREPETSVLRARINDQAPRLDILSIADRAKYQQRFSRVSSFFERFYGRVVPPDRAFDLLSTDSTQHWSAHVFPNERVAFYGFSSCFSNDAYWRGASLDEDAVRSAAQHAREHAPGMIWVAVWHHGLFSRRGDPDHVQPRELGYLRFNGFHLGIHGHTHIEEFGDLRDVLGDAFPVVATGSFGVGPEERPDTLNQFAILDLSPNYLYIDRFERDRATNWKTTRQVPYRLLRGALSTAPFNEARVHRRLFEFDPSSGRTDITITFEDLALHDELILAEPVGPYSNLVFDENAEADGSQLRIRETPVVPGRTRLSLSGTGRTYKRLTWSCILSNILTRDRAVLQMKRWPPFGERLRLNADWRERDWVAHVVTMHCKELIIEIRLRQGAAPGPLFTGQVSMRVFDRKHDAEDKEDTSEADRCQITPSPDGRSVVARVEHPVLGYRYVLGYRPALAGVAYERDATLMLIRNVADVARRSAPGPSLRTALTDAVEQRIRTALGIDAGAQLLWHGYLWNRDERCLQTAFGRCPWSAAAETFEYGRGVAGHAFRTCQPASYISSEKKRSLICLLPEGVEPEWIVAVPILLSKDGPAVGVVGFSGSGNADADRELRDYAQRMAIRGERSYAPSATEQDQPTFVESRLFPAITAAFWDELPKRIKGLVAQADVDEADRVYSYWRQVPLASTTA